MLAIVAMISLVLTACSGGGSSANTPKIDKWASEIQAGKTFDKEQINQMCSDYISELPTVTEILKDAVAKNDESTVKSYVEDENSPFVQVTACISEHAEDLSAENQKKFLSEVLKLATMAESEQ